MTSTSPLMTWLALAVAIALTTAGPLAERSVQLSNARAVAPARAPASAEFCAWLRAVISMPTSIASMLAATNAMHPRPTKTSENPDSSRAVFRRRVIDMAAPPPAPRYCCVPFFFS
jgi:hypothetical protein